jgi:hypothetical protein
VPVAQKIATGLVVAMVATAVLLPGRQTVPALNATKNLLTGAEHTAITGAA